MAEVKEILFKGLPYEIEVKPSGWFGVNGKNFRGKEKAIKYRAKLLEADLEADSPDLSDLPVDGFTGFNDRVVKYNGTLLDLPMNFPYLPDGKTLNPYYDRRWHWGWAAHRNPSDVADKRERGFTFVDRETLEAGVANEEIPDHYKHVLREEGSYLVYGDLILMRQPRVLYRQLQAQKDETALRAVKGHDERIKQEFAMRGMDGSKSPVQSSTEIAYPGG